MSDIKLFEYSSTIIIESKRSSKFASVDRKSGQVSLVDSKPSEEKSGTPAVAVLGSIRLLAGNYLVVVTAAKEVDSLLPGHKIFAVKEVQLIQLDKSAKLTEDQKADEDEYKSLISGLFNGPSSNFFFSTTFDLTNTLQAQLKRGPISAQSNWKDIDEQFMWNRHLAKDFQAAGCSDFIVPTIRGFVSINHLRIKDKNVDFIILSRLSWKRVGTRYNIRGVDQQGNVANFVETEQIMKYNDSISCYLQIRGSIPLPWSQKANLKYKPRAVIKQDKVNAGNAGFRNHMDAIRARYNRLTLINLVDQKGNEKELAAAYKSNVEQRNDDNLNYVDYDFHKETKGMKYQNIYNLVKQIEPYSNTYGYLSYDLKSNTINKSQDGVLRVNCIDCLDRTNVVESVFARVFLNKKLQEVGIFDNNDSIDKHEVVERTFKTVWADNGDAISNIYTGTGALKADYTRTGKRSFMGLLQDGLKSANRYYLNNFTDGISQDAMNLVLGKYIVDQSAASPFKANRTTVKNIYKVLTIGFFVSLFMVAVNILQLPTASNFRDKVVLLSGWIVFTFILYAVLVRNGRDIVNNPMLKNRKKDV